MLGRSGQHFLLAQFEKSNAVRREGRDKMLMKLNMRHCHSLIQIVWRRVQCLLFTARFNWSDDDDVTPDEMWQWEVKQLSFNVCQEIIYKMKVFINKVGLYQHQLTWTILSQSKSKSKVKVKRTRHFDSNQKLKIQFQNSILDCEKVESNSSFNFNGQFEGFKKAD